MNVIPMPRTQGQAEPCRQIWLGVILQAARDMIINGENTTDRRLARFQAECWLGSRDFYTVCSLAGLDASKVEARLRDYLSQKAKGQLDIRNTGFARGNVGMHKTGRACA